MFLERNFSNLKIVLVEPSGPLNVGSVARLCSNYEVEELRIVSPKCDIFSLDAKKMALKGQKYHQKIQKMNLYLHQSFHKMLEPNHNQKLLFVDHQKPYNV